MAILIEVAIFSRLPPGAKKLSQNLNENLADFEWKTQNFQKFRPKNRRAKTSWKKATKILVPQKGFRSKRFLLFTWSTDALMVGKWNFYVHFLCEATRKTPRSFIVAICGPNKASTWRLRSLMVQWKQIIVQALRCGPNANGSGNLCDL